MLLTTHYKSQINVWFTSLYGVSLSQRFSPWLSQKSLMKKELGPEKESQRRYKQYYHYSEKNTITTARKKTTLNWQRTGHLWVRKAKLPFLYEVHRIFKIKFEKYFLSAKFPSAVTFHIYLYPCNFFFFAYYIRCVADAANSVIFAKRNNNCGICF